MAQLLMARERMLVTSFCNHNSLLKRIQQPYLGISNLFGAYA
jgi:hypothetical protein